MRMSWLEGYIGERNDGRTSSIRDGEGCISTASPRHGEDDALGVHIKKGEPICVELMAEKEMAEKEKKLAVFRQL
jgi:hypothetical protein